MYSEVEKVILKNGFDRMLEAGWTNDVIETAEIVGEIMDPDGPKVIRRAYQISIQGVIGVF